MNIDAVVAMCLGCPALIKKRIGLRNIPPPIPTIPDKNPIKEPIEIEKKFEILFILNLSLLKFLQLTSNKRPAAVKTKNSNISNISFSIEIEAPKKVNGIDPIKYGPRNLRLMLPDLI
jgi:hypothetical protein